MTDAELACLAVAELLLRYDDERHWLRAAARIGHLFPRLLANGVQPAAEERCPADGGRAAVAGGRDAGHRGDAAADGRHARPVRAVRPHREALDLFGWAGYCYCPSH